MAANTRATIRAHHGRLMPCIQQVYMHSAREAHTQSARCMRRPLERCSGAVYTKACSLFHSLAVMNAVSGREGSVSKSLFER